MSKKAATKKAVKKSAPKPSSRAQAEGKEVEVKVDPVKSKTPQNESSADHAFQAGQTSNGIRVASETPKVTGKEKYYQAVGRRKESIARVRLYTKKASDLSILSMPDGTGKQASIPSEEKALIIVNGKDYRDYFTDANLWNVVESPLRKLKSINRFKATVIVRGGGKSGQADAIKHGLARTLVEFDGNFRKKLKKSGYLIRDPRAKERRKYGLKKARKAPRWSKR